MTDTKEWKYEQHNGFCIDPFEPSKNRFYLDLDSKNRFYLDLDYWDTCYGEYNTVSVDALAIYYALKEYFKGTEHE